MMAADLAAYRMLIPDDYTDAVHLYAELARQIPALGEAARADQFRALLDHPGTAIWGAEVAGRIVSMATVHVLPNMTRGGRPYALVENVVTLASHRRQGFGRRVMEAIAAAAWGQGCYKIMLLTGRQNRAAGFYQRLGYDEGEKHGMVLRGPGA